MHTSDVKKMKEKPMNIKHVQTTINTATYRKLFNKARKVNIKLSEALRQAITLWLKQGEENA